MAALVLPPTVSLWVGNVAHTRRFPKRHAFRYPIHLMMVDPKAIDDGSALAGWGFLAGTSPWCAVSLRREDFMRGCGLDDTPLDLAVRELVRRETGDDSAATGPIRLLSHPRYMGYCFNPAAFFFVFKPEDPSKPGAAPELECIVVQVTNTPWEEMHSYVLHPGAAGVTACDCEGSQLRYRWPKTFHVSPFMPLKHEYDWTFDVPCVLADGAPSSLSMSSKQSRISADAYPPPAPQPPVASVPDDEDDGSGAPVGSTVLTTALRLESVPLSPWSLVLRLLTLPWLTVLVQVWIHWEALRLVSKGIGLFPHPTGATTAMTRAVEAVATPIISLLQWGGLMSHPAAPASDDSSAATTALGKARVERQDPGPTHGPKSEAAVRRRPSPTSS